MNNVELTDLLPVRNVLRIALYVRVSSKEQVDGYSIGEQIDRLKKYCEAMGWTIFKIYTDPGYSGGNTDRPGLQDMMKDVVAGRIDKVVVYKLDRLSRSQLDTLYLIEKVFLANNTDFVSMSENFDTSTPFGRAMIGILAVFAQLEREQIKERMGMGKEARAKDGKWHGGATEPIGYDYNKVTEELKINDYEAMQVQELYELFLKGTPLRAVERLFKEKGYTHKHGVWDPKTMRRVMRSKTYLGYIKHRDEWYPGDHDPIIDEETHRKAVKLLDNRAEQYRLSGVKPGAQTTYLGGLLHCKHCGGKYTKQANGRTTPKTLWYMCYSRCKKVKAMIKDPNCKNKNWKMNELDALVFAEIKQLALDPDYIRNAQKEKVKESDAPNKIAIIKKEIEKIDEQISRFMDLYGIGKFTIDQVSNKIDPLNDRRTSLERELESLNASTGELTEEETLRIVKNLEEALERDDFNEIRLIIETLIYYIEIDNEDVYIHWKFL